MIDQLQKTPFFRILLPFISGIVLAAMFPGLSEVAILGIILLLSIFLFFSMLESSGYSRRLGTGALFTLFFLFLGVWVMLHENKPRSYPGGEYYHALLLEKPVAKIKSYQAEILITTVDSQGFHLPVKEKMIAYFSGDSKANELNPGSRMVFNRTPGMINNRGNPFEFNYREYMRKKGISRQVYLNAGSWHFTGEDRRFRIHVMAEKIREYLLDIYRKNGLEGNEFEILSALTLGYRKSMDRETRQLFAATGAAHVLAVSGLHVGIVYMLLNLFLGFMHRRKSTRFLFFILASAVLWIFSFITGLSPPVSRAALMFTIVLAGENMRRPSNIFNTLSVSAFILLLEDPNLLFDAGMQLSYAALSGIVYFQPLLSQLVDFKSKYAIYLRDLLAVSVAAQITTFPLSCYYFHQFPVYFWISNLLVIPLAFVFIFMGLMIFLLSPFGVIAGIIARCAAFMVKFLSLFLQQIENIPGSLLAGFEFSASALFFSCLFLFSIVLFIETRNHFFFRSAIGIVTLIMFLGAGKKLSLNFHREIIAYNCEVPVVHLINGRSSYIVAPEEFILQGLHANVVKPVSDRYRLKRAVIVPLGVDFRDDFLIKQKNRLFFQGTLLEFQHGETIRATGFYPDLVIRSGTKVYALDGKEKAVIVSYRKNKDGNLQEGARLIPAVTGACHIQSQKSP